MSIQCENAVSARISYNYTNHPVDDLAWNGSIYSNKPGVIVSTIRLNEGAVSCEPYQLTIVIPLIHWTGANQTGVSYGVGNLYRDILVYGPIGLFSISESGNSNSYYGVAQTSYLECRGVFNGYGECQPE